MPFIFKLLVKNKTIINWKKDKSMLIKIIKQIEKEEVEVEDKEDKENETNNITIKIEQ